MTNEVGGQCGVVVVFSFFFSFSLSQLFLKSKFFAFIHK